jgi:hypothetical protein
MSRSGEAPNIGPDQDLILARCSGGPLEHTGVLAGMSGSPVLVDGKLIGAVAYSWGFSKDAIAGITPIEEMLAVAARNEAPRRALASGLPREPLSFLRSADRLSSFFAGRLAMLGARPAVATSLGLPLAVSGLGGGGSARWPAISSARASCPCRREAPGALQTRPRRSSPARRSGSSSSGATWT